MADFNKWVEPGKRRYRRIKAGYQNIYEDAGNWTTGKVGQGIQAGTNMSVSAYKLTALWGRPVYAHEMMSLSEAEALDIYKTEYWDQVRGDEINSQVIADFLADMKSSGGGTKAIQRALNDLGENLDIDGNIGPLTLAAINRQIDKSVAQLNNAFRERMIEHYQNAARKGGNAKFLKGWLSSLDKDYPEMSVKAESVGLPEDFNNKKKIYIIIGVVFFLLILLCLWLFLKK